MFPSEIPLILKFISLYQNQSSRKSTSSKVSLIMQFIRTLQRHFRLYQFKSSREKKLFGSEIPLILKVIAVPIPPKKLFANGVLNIGDDVTKWIGSIVFMIAFEAIAHEPIRSQWQLCHVSCVGIASLNVILTEPNRHQTTLSSQPQFRYTDVNARETKWPLHYEGIYTQSRCSLTIIHKSTG